MEAPEQGESSGFELTPEGLVAEEVRAELGDELDKPKQKRRLAGFKEWPLTTPDEFKERADLLFWSYNRALTEYDHKDKRVKNLRHNLSCVETELRNSYTFSNALLAKVVSARQAAAAAEAALKELEFNTYCNNQILQFNINRYKSARDRYIQAFQAAAQERDQLLYQKYQLQQERDQLQLETIRKETTIHQQCQELADQLYVIAEQDALIDSLRNPPCEDQATSGYRSVQASVQ